AIAAAPAELDVLVHGDALDHGEPEPSVVDLRLERAEPLAAPGVADRQIVQGAHDRRHPGDLADVSERDRVRRAEPAKARDHARNSSSTSSTLARLKSPGTVSLRALAATANSSAAAGRSPASNRAMRAAAKLAPPPTRSPACTPCRRLRADHR